MENQNLFQVFREHFPSDPALPFLETEEGIVYSYADMDCITGRYANLLQNLQISLGDRVAVQVEKSPEALFLYLACLRAGVIFLPMNPAYREAEVEYLLADAQPSLVLASPMGEKLMAEIAQRRGIKNVLSLGQNGKGSFVERAEGLSEDFDTVKLDAKNDVAAILYTSGTTGRPKGAMLTHRNLATNAEVLHQIWQFNSDDVLLHALPIFHAHGLFVATNTQLMNGGSMLYLNKFDTQKVIEFLPRATVFMGVPTFYTRLLATENFTRESCGNMRLFVSGSAPLLEETFETFQHRTGFTVVERYGMTETVMNTSNPLGGEIAGSVGPALPGIEARVTNEKGDILKSDAIGVLEVRGPNVAKGYWRNEERTRSEFMKDGFFITGDLARIDENDYIWIVGRAKDLIISGGYNVYPKEVELLIDEFDGIRESAVIGLPHPDFGEAVTAVVTQTQGVTKVRESAIIAQVESQLARFKVPKRVFFVEDLPRNSMGKVQKNILRETYAGTFQVN